VNTFAQDIYLGCKILYEEQRDMTSKLNKYLKILGNLNNVTKPNLVQKQSRLELFINLVIETKLDSRDEIRFRGVRLD
jgi:hypothetical protein